MKQKVMKYLSAGEEICWESQVKPFPLLDPGTRMPVLLNWVITTVVTVAFLGYYFGMLCQGTFSPVFVAMVLGTAAIIMLRPINRRKNLLGAYYCITNKRVILVTKDASYYCIEREKIGNLFEVQDHDGEMSVVMGSGLDTSNEKISWKTPKIKLGAKSEGPWDYVDGMVLFRAEKVEEALPILRQEYQLA